MSSAGFSYNTGIQSFRRSYEICPIYLVGGIASQGAGGIPGGGLPITSILQSSLYPQGVTTQAAPAGQSLGGGGPVGASDSLDAYFAHFEVQTGGTLIDNEIAHYPFANMGIAANAVIQQPTHVSLRMLCPADPARGVTYANKQAIITALRNSLLQHINLGGYFTVSTPSFIYNNGLLLTLEDDGEEYEGGQVQTAFLWNFEFPLITLAQAQGALSALNSKISGNVQLGGDPPGSQVLSTLVAEPGSNTVQSVVPAAMTPVASNIATPLSPTVQQQISGIAPIQPGN